MRTRESVVSLPILDAIADTRAAAGRDELRESIARGLVAEAARLIALAERFESSGDDIGAEFGREYRVMAVTIDNLTARVRAKEWG